MSAFRVLPARLAPRFGDAPRAQCRVEDLSFELVVADRFALRLVGLSRLDEEAMVPLLLPRCRSVHTFGMRAPIDVVWLEFGEGGEGAVLAVEPALEPRRMTRAPRGADRRRTAAVELAPGDAPGLGLVDGARVVMMAAEG